MSGREAQRAAACDRAPIEEGSEEKGVGMARRAPATTQGSDQDSGGVRAGSGLGAKDQQDT